MKGKNPEGQRVSYGATNTGKRPQKKTVTDLKLMSQICNIEQ